MAVGLFPRFIVVFLVVDFRLPECIYLFKFGDNRITFFLQQIDQLLDRFLLVFVRVVDGRAVLFADVWTLTINLSWIVDFKEESRQFFIGSLRSIESNF